MEHLDLRGDDQLNDEILTEVSTTCRELRTLKFGLECQEDISITDVGIRAIAAVTKINTLMCKRVQT